MKAYKGFTKDLSCLGLQYEVGKSYETSVAIPCEWGFHACKFPLDVWDYYGPIEGHRFCEVEQDGYIAKNGNKQVSTKLKVVAEISITEMIEAHIDLVMKSTVKKVKTLADKIIDLFRHHTQINSSSDYTTISSSDDHMHIGSSGRCARVGSSGYRAKIGSSGSNALIGSSGGCAQIGSSGEHARIGALGEQTKIGSSGEHAHISSSGDNVTIGSSGYSARISSSSNGALIGSSGNEARIGSSGGHAEIDCTGDDAVVACAGINTKVRAKIGTWVCLPEYVYIKECYKCIGMKAFQIDGKEYPADKWLMLNEGKVIVVG